MSDEGQLAARRKGKTDSLFVISREANMKSRQDQLATEFPQFIDTIEAKSDEFDYHIMVDFGPKLHRRAAQGRWPGCRRIA